MSTFAYQINLMKLLYALTLAVITTTATSFGFASGGPDAYGYTWMTSLDAGGPAYNWIDITSRPGVQTVTGLADDNSAASMVNIGFGFHYYWSDYSQLKIGSNGWLSFNGISNIASCFPGIPTAGGAGDNILAPLMGDLNFTGAGNPGQVKYWTNSVDSCVISYINVPFWSVSAPGWTGGNNFQVILCAADSSITFQYGSLAGFSPNAACTDLVVGIENSTGNIGLQVHNDAMPPSNYAIKFDYPSVVLLSIQDPLSVWNMNSGNKAVFLPLNSPHSLQANYRNGGNTEVTTMMRLTATILNSSSATVHSTASSIPSLAASDDSTVTFPSTWTPDATGQYTFQSQLTNAQDVNNANNTNNTEVDIVDMCAASMLLSYVSGNTPSASVNWNGGANDDGVAVYFAPPVYPYTVSTLQFFISSNIADGYTAQIYDDNGPNGSPGTQLFTLAVPNASVITNAWNTLNIPSPVTLNDGGFYVVWLQGGTTIFLGAETTGPLSRRNYEILDGSWADYRENGTRDVCIRAQIDGYNANPTAGFSNTTDNLTADFTDLSNGTYISWNWDFGDGSTASTEQHPSHTYATAGTYMVCLTTSNTCGNAQECHQVVVCDDAVAVASATADYLAATFTDASTGTVTGWQWDFGDGASSTDQHPGHTYPAPGTYTYCLIATNDCGYSDTICGTVTVCDTLAANYSHITDILATTFTDLSNEAISWTWDFGDGVTSTDQNPVHGFTAPGVYNVCLAVTNACGEDDTICQAVTICGVPTAAYLAEVDGLAAQFTDWSTGVVDDWHWDFGDGNSSSDQNPEYTYPADGTYNVCLVAGNSCGYSNTICQDVTVCGYPEASFTMSPDGLTIDFTDQSTGNNINSWDWSFGDGNTSDEQNPSHTYAATGTYEVCLIVQKNCGSQDTICQDVVIDFSGISEQPQLVLNGYPNPTDGLFHINFTDELQNAQLEITDLTGKVILTQSVSGTFTETDVAELASGFYKIRIVHATGIGVMTLIKR